MPDISKELRGKFKKIRMFIMDVDGTLTDGKIYLGNSGEEMKAFNVKDGLGINLLHQHNIIPVLITGRESEIVNIRAEELNIKEVYQGIKDKVKIYNMLKEKYRLKDEDISYIGDDLNDLSLLEKVGTSFTVDNCAELLKEKCDYSSSKNGGEGAVREIIDLVLESII